MSFKNIIKSIFGGNENSIRPDISNEEANLLNDLFQESQNKNVYDLKNNVKFSDLENYKKIKSLDEKKKTDFIFHVVSQISRIRKRIRINQSNNIDSWRLTVYDELLSYMCRSKLNATEDQLTQILNEFKNNSTSQYRSRFTDWPVAYLVIQFEKHVKAHGLSEKMGDFIKKALEWPEFNPKNNIYWGSDVEKAKVRLQKTLQIGSPEGSIPAYKLKKDAIGEYINNQIEEMPEETRNFYYELFHHCLTSSSSKPSKKYIKAAKEVIDKIKPAKFKPVVHDWFEFFIKMKENEVVHQNTYNGRVYEYSTFEFLHGRNSVLLKGLVWSMVIFHDSKSLEILSRLATRAFKKIPGTGPAAAAVGNAALYVLANSKGLEGISHLSRLKLKVTQNSTKTLIQNYVSKASEKLGISASEIEELAVPDFGLQNGQKSIEFDDYVFKIEVQGIGKVNSSWIKPDGKSQKSVPAFIKQNKKLADRLKKAKDDIKNIKKYLTAQRDRIDRSYLDDRIWSMENFQKYYFDHGLVSYITKKMIWIFTNSEQNEKISAFWDSEQEEWVDKNWKQIHSQWFSEGTKVELWHPIYVKPAEVLKWRKNLYDLEIVQPIKQAYREVYLLTDAEINTVSYSNRMAAHLIKQHQFNALAAVRNWKYTLLGAFDHGLEGKARIEIPAHQLRAEFWINELMDEDSYNEAGIWNYIATDQVRYIDQNGETVNLVNIPKIVFSEIMRDVDLFVGVCSVGNDPEWQDNGGLPQYHNYWRNYSFGDLSEVAKTRKSILENLIPRLKIKDIAHIDGKFLVVKGKIKTYKIHMGSTNILMEPNDQYLCIVPSRSTDAQMNKVFLPFEGDRGLSLVLSKAFLLAEDDKITDRTILSQLR